MPRITIELSIEEHRALKLLTILEGKKLGAVLNEAIHSCLAQKGAYDLKYLAILELVKSCKPYTYGF